MAIEFFYLDQHRFTSSLAEKLFKNSSHSYFVFCGEKKEEFYFHFNDLKPRVLIINHEFLDISWLRDNYAHFSFFSFSLVVLAAADFIQTSDYQEMVQLFQGKTIEILELPIDISLFIHQVEKFL